MTKPVPGSDLENLLYIWTTTKDHEARAHWAQKFCEARKPYAMAMDQAFRERLTERRGDAALSGETSRPSQRSGNMLAGYPHGEPTRITSPARSYLPERSDIMPSMRNNGTAGSGPNALRGINGRDQLYQPRGDPGVEPRDFIDTAEDQEEQDRRDLNGCAGAVDQMLNTMMERDQEDNGGRHQALLDALVGIINMHHQASQGNGNGNGQDRRWRSRSRAARDQNLPLKTAIDWPSNGATKGRKFAQDSAIAEMNTRSFLQRHPYAAHIRLHGSWRD
jgi:hypothetical protein